MVLKGFLNGVTSGQQYSIGEKPTVTTLFVVVVVFTLKTVLTSIQYPSLPYSSRQRNEFPLSQTQNKVQKNND